MGDDSDDINDEDGDDDELHDYDDLGDGDGDGDSDTVVGEDNLAWINLGSVQLTIGPTVFWSLHSPSWTVLS